MISYFTLFLSAGRGGRTRRKSKWCRKFWEFRWWKRLGWRGQETAQASTPRGKSKAAGKVQGGSANITETSVFWD